MGSKTKGRKSIENLVDVATMLGPTSDPSVNTGCAVHKRTLLRLGH
jgi:hypothetical protein